MKNICILFLVIICFSIQFGKAQTAINCPTLTPSKKIIFNKSFLDKKQSSTSSSITSQGWFNYGAEVESMYAASSEFNSNYLFPDSLGYANFGGTVAPMWIHHISELVDFDSPMFSINPATSWVATSSSNTFNIDSMSMFYAYSRNHSNPLIVDTLIVTVYDNLTASNLSLSGVVGAYASNYGVDTFSYQKIGYNPLSNVICAPTVTTSPQVPPVGEYQFKVLLTAPDTAISMFREKKFKLPISFSSSRNNLVVADISFKPGYTYSLTQQIDLTANSFQFVSREENGNSGGVGTYMNHIDCNYGSSLCDYSMSYILSQEIRYNKSPYWNYRYLPTIAFTAQYGYEHHLISFHLTDTTIAPCQVHSQFSIFADTLNPGDYYAYETSTGSGTLSYLWDFGDGNTSTLQYPFHQYAIPGQYVICLTLTATSGTTSCNDVFCDSSSVHKTSAGYIMSQFNVIPQVVTGINANKNFRETIIYPNPVKDELTIEVSNKENQRLKYVLVDALGRTILTGPLNSKTNINTSSLEKGFYSLMLIDEKENVLGVTKLVK